MISRVITSKPEELRVFLEEAAGVSKYRERRRETELRLEDTRENLSRVGDIRAELGAQLEHLAQQAEVAARYQDLQAQLALNHNLLAFTRLREAEQAKNRYANEVQKVTGGPRGRDGEAARERARARGAAQPPLRGDRPALRRCRARSTRPTPRCSRSSRRSPSSARTAGAWARSSRASRPRSRKSSGASPRRRPSAAAGRRDRERPRRHRARARPSSTRPARRCPRPRRRAEGGRRRARRRSRDDRRRAGAGRRGDARIARAQAPRRSSRRARTA